MGDGANVCRCHDASPSPCALVAIIIIVLNVATNLWNDDSGCYAQLLLSPLCQLSIIHFHCCLLWAISPLVPPRQAKTDEVWEGNSAFGGSPRAPVPIGGRGGRERGGRLPSTCLTSCSLSRRCVSLHLTSYSPPSSSSFLLLL